MTEQNASQKPADITPADKKPADRTTEDRTTGNPPVSPVETFDLDQVDKDRRMFGNGDTDREDLKQ